MQSQSERRSAKSKLRSSPNSTRRKDRQLACRLRGASDKSTHLKKRTSRKTRRLENPLTSKYTERTIWPGETETSEMIASCPSSPLPNTTRTVVLASHQLQKTAAASLDSKADPLSKFFGPDGAAYLRAKLWWPLQQPSQVLRATTGESGKSYTKRNVKTTLPSGSPASLKKRS